VAAVQKKKSTDRTGVAGGRKKNGFAPREKMRDRPKAPSSTVGKKGTRELLELWKGGEPLVHIPPPEGEFAAKLTRARKWVKGSSFQERGDDVDGDPSA